MSNATPLQDQGSHFRFYEAVLKSKSLFITKFKNLCCLDPSNVSDVFSAYSRIKKSRSLISGLLSLSQNSSAL